jgi:FlaA1/EpsC-like NDP-sugar epimerase
MNFAETALEKILGRSEHDLEDFFQESASFYEGKKIIITGSMGSLGTALNSFIKDYNINCSLTNIDIAATADNVDHLYFNVFDSFAMKTIIKEKKPDFIFHFAADKHAPSGERTPDSTIDINIYGTQIIIDATKSLNTKIVLSSTCKSCNPETVYGASKLIAERLILNKGHNVARYYNVVESSDNVFEIWNSEYNVEDHLVMNCNRYFITIKEALALSLFTGMQDSGRYTIDPGDIRNMLDVYKDLYGRNGAVVPARRGDRITEVRLSTSELLSKIEDSVFEKIINEHDVIL